MVDAFWSFGQNFIANKIRFWLHLFIRRVLYGLWQYIVKGDRSSEGGYPITNQIKGYDNVELVREHFPRR
jgi:hypothetical protein